MQTGYVELFCVRGDLIDQLVRVVAPRAQHAGHGPGVLAQVAQGCTDSQAAADPQQSCRVNRPGNAEVDRKGEPAVTLGRQPLNDGLGVKTHLGGCMALDARLGQQHLLDMQCLMQHGIGDQRMTLGIGSDADVKERVADLAQRLQQPDRAVERSGRRGDIAADQEYLAEAHRFDAAQQLFQVITAGDHASRYVGHGAVTQRTQLSGQIQCVLKRLGGRCRHRDRRPRRQVGQLLGQVAQWDEFPLGVLQQATALGGILLGERATTTLCAPPRR